MRKERENKPDNGANVAQYFDEHRATDIKFDNSVAQCHGTESHHGDFQPIQNDNVFTTRARQYRAM